MLDLHGAPRAQANLSTRGVISLDATKQDYIPTLFSVPRVDAKPGGWHLILIHSPDEVRFTVIRLQPGGGEVPKHLHNGVWDYFMALSGEAVIETRTKEEVEQDFEMSKVASSLSGRVMCIG